MLPCLPLEGLPGLPGWLLHFLLFQAAEDCHLCEPSDGKDKPGERNVQQNAYRWVDGDRRRVNLQAATRTPAGRAGVRTGRVAGAQDSGGLWFLWHPATELSPRSLVHSSRRRGVRAARLAAWAGAAHGARGGKGRKISLCLLFSLCSQKGGDLFQAGSRPERAGKCAKP